jgi:hypothetical protein
MAKSRNSVSQHIRDVLSENPDMTGPEIISALDRQGIEAKKNLVYYVKARFKAKKRRQGRKNVAKVMGGGNGSMDAISVIRKVKGLAAEVGGMSKLKELVEALS